MRVFAGSELFVFVVDDEDVIMEDEVVEPDEFILSSDNEDEECDFLWLFSIIFKSIMATAKSIFVLKDIDE